LWGGVLGFILEGGGHVIWILFLILSPPSLFRVGGGLGIVTFLQHYK